jgi:hypothetical protein
MSIKQRKGDSKPLIQYVKTVPLVPKAIVTKQEIELLRDKTIQMVLKNPEKAAMILNQWLSQGKSLPISKKSGKKAA